VQVGEWSDAAFDHRERLENDGAASQSRGPMPLLAVVAFQGDLIFTRFGGHRC